MAKKTKAEGKIINKPTESPVDVIIKDPEKVHDDLNVKTVEAESNVKLEDDKGEGEAITLRFFTFAVDPIKVKELHDKQVPLPSPQQLFNAHTKQIELELWKDEWQVMPEVPPRLMFSKDFSHYQIIVAAKPAKGSFLSINDKPRTLSEIAHVHDTSANR